MTNDFALFPVPPVASPSSPEENGAYWKGRYATVYCGDSRNILPGLRADGFGSDLIATDPPYGQSWRSGRRNTKFDAIAGDDGSLDVPAVLDLALKTLRRGRHLYVFGKIDLTGLPVTEAAELIWDKGVLGPGDLTCAWGPMHEPIQFCTYEISAANRAKGYGRLSARLRRGSVLSFQRPHGSAVTRHPTEKPVPLMRALIESSTVVGETVLDPFAGVGSTLVAAVAAGRHAVGIELEERYCEIAARRLEKVEELAAAIEDL